MVENLDINTYASIVANDSVRNAYGPDHGTHVRSLSQYLSHQATSWIRRSTRTQELLGLSCNTTDASARQDSRIPIRHDCI